MDKHLDADIVGDYAEGILEPSARAAADAHLRGCAECRREVETAAAYFRELSGLESIRAPADFLAKVRARLPGEAPWRRALAAAFRSLRAVPMQLALATLIGVTVITVYVQQGGMERPTVVSETAAPLAEQPTASAPVASAPAEPAPASPLAKIVQRPPAPAPRGRQEAPKTRSLKKGASGATKPSAPRPEPPPERKNRPDASQGGAQAHFLRETGSLDAMSPGSALESSTVGRSRELLANSGTGESAEPAADPAKDQWRAKAKAEAAQTTKAADDVSTRGYAEEAIAEESQATQPKENAGARAESKTESAYEGDKRVGSAQAPKPAAARPAAAPPERPAHPMQSLRLRASADTVALRSGLKAMGVKVEAVAQAAGAPPRWRLEAPASMLSDIQTYLARYGRVSGPAPRPNAAGSFAFELVLSAP